MTIIHEIQMDLARPGPVPRITAKQGEALSRRVALKLLENGSPWTLPPEAGVVIRYHACCPDGTDVRGIYDTLPTGECASSRTDGGLTLELVPRMLEGWGLVTVDVLFSLDSRLLATGNFEILVERAPAEGTRGEFQGYYEVCSLEQLNNWIRQTELELYNIQARIDELAKA